MVKLKHLYNMYDTRSTDVTSVAVTGRHRHLKVVEEYSEAFERAGLG